MKNSAKKVLLGTTTLLAAGLVGHTVEAANTDVQMQAIIVAPVAITQTRVLNFGSITESGGGTLTVDNTDGITPSAATVNSIGGTITAGGFKVIRDAARAVNVTMPASADVIDTAAVGPNMAVTGFTIDGAPASAATPFVIPGGGAATETGFRVGGVLNVAGGQTPGTYTGTVTVTAVY